MKKPQYSPEESLNRIKLMMGYDMSKTLNENKSIIFEQDATNDDTKIAQSFISSAAVWNGTDEEGLVSSIKLIKDKRQFARVDGLVKEIWKTKYRRQDFGVEKTINDELGYDDLEFIKQIADYLKTIGIPATYEIVKDEGLEKRGIDKYVYKPGSFKLNFQNSVNDVSGLTNVPTTTPATYEEVQSGKGNLKIGMKGPAVNQLQQMLVTIGYNLGTTGVNKNGVDGDFGNLTKNAVKDFQSKNGLLVNGVPDGIVGKNTAPKIVEKYNESQKAATSEQPNNVQLAQGEVPKTLRLNQNQATEQPNSGQFAQGEIPRSTRFNRNLVNV